MRWEEALKIRQKWTPEQARNDLERLIITGEIPADKVVGLACQALDKQIPKKPEYSGDGYSDGKLVYDYAKCPTCGNDNFEYDINNWGCKFCPDCGQALDWSETE